MSLEGFLNDMELGLVEGRYRVQVTSLEVELEKVKARLRGTQDSLASMSAVAYAVMASLRAIDAKNPVLDPDLRARIGGAGITAFRVANDWEAALDAGRTFKVPPREGGEPLPLEQLSMENSMLKAERDLLQRQVEDLRRKVAFGEQQLAAARSDLVDYVAQREAFRRELARCDADNPMVSNVELRKRVAEAGQRAYALSNGDWKAVKEAGGTFMDEIASKGLAGKQGQS